MSDYTNPNAYYTHDEYPWQDVRYSDRWREVRCQVAVGPRNGMIVGFDPESRGVKP